MFSKKNKQMEIFVCLPCNSIMIVNDMSERKKASVNAFTTIVFVL